MKLKAENMKNGLDIDNRSHTQGENFDNRSHTQGENFFHIRSFQILFGNKDLKL
jgi:hypothetical protein